MFSSLQPPWNSLGGGLRWAGARPSRPMLQGEHFRRALDWKVGACTSVFQGFLTQSDVLPKLIVS